MLEQHLTQMARDLEMESAPGKDETGMYTLHINPERTIALKELDPGCLFFARIGPCPDKNQEQMYMYLMRGNFLGQGTGGGVLAIDDNEKFLTLTLTMPYDINYKNFKETLEDFVNFADYWRQELLAHQKMDAVLT